MFENRLKDLRLEKHLNMKQTAQQLNIPYTTYVGYEKNEREPNSETLILLADFFECSVDYLVGRSSERNGVVDEKIESNIEFMSQDKIHMIPVFESVSAGFGAYACSDIVDYIPLFINNPADVPDMMCIKVQGDSMFPIIDDGDIVVVRKQSSVDSGQIAVVLIDNEEGFVKRIEYDNNTIELKSENPYYKPMFFSDEETLRVSVVGLVKQVIKNL